MEGTASIGPVLTLFTADRCPYAARARIVLAEQGLEYDAVEIDLDERLGVLDRALEASPFLSGRGYGLADIAYFPWILQARENLGVELGSFPSLAAWFERLSERPAIRAERELVAS